MIQFVRNLLLRRRNARIKRACDELQALLDARMQRLADANALPFHEYARRYGIDADAEIAAAHVRVNAAREANPHHQARRTLIRLKFERLANERALRQAERRSRR